MPNSFAADIEEWARKVEGAAELIFKESTQVLVEQLWDLVPKDTRFLAKSLMASTTSMPVLDRANPGGFFEQDFGQIELVIAGADIGDTIYLGYTANYGAHVHYGTHGRSGRPWVTLVAQRWNEIVQAKALEIRARLGL